MTAGGPEHASIQAESILCFKPSRTLGTNAVQAGRCLPVGGRRKG